MLPVENALVRAATWRRDVPDSVLVAVTILATARD